MSKRKYEVRISKSETNPNDRNPNDLNEEVSAQATLFWGTSSFEHLDFDIVSDLGFGISNLKLVKFDFEAKTLQKC
jgi:hypothetical protein